MPGSLPSNLQWAGLCSCAGLVAGMFIGFRQGRLEGAFVGGFVGVVIGANLGWLMSVNWWCCPA